jgi:phospholipase C
MEDGMWRLSTVGLIAALIVSGCSGSVGNNVVPTAPPSSPPLASIQHVVILVQENRSFDNLFMSYPGADTTTSGACTPSQSLKICLDGKAVALRPITLESNGQPGGVDIDHSHHAFEVEFDGGKMDGFNLIDYGSSGQTGIPAKFYPYAYVERNETAPYWTLAHDFTLADHMFSTATASSFIAHQQLIAGTTALNATESLTDQPDNVPWGCDAPTGTVTAIINIHGVVNEFGGPFPCFTQYKTMADLLDAGNTSWRYYVAAVTDVLEFSGQVWNGYDAIKKVRYGSDWKTNISSPNTNVLSDVAKGTLPKVSWVIPTLNDSDHPASGCNHGPYWVTKVVNAIGKSKYWKNTAIVVVWDDWGGFYDNVPPPQLSYTTLGMRVPMLVISAYARHGYVSHTQYDFGSILKYIEQNFGLGSLGTSDASANSISDSFDFTQSPSAYTPVVVPSPKPCFQSSAKEIMEKDGIPE